VIASSRSLVIFANAPEKGHVKSRIAADLGPDVALTAYRTLAEHAVAAASQVDWCRKTIAYAPNGKRDAMRDWFGDLFDYRAQGDGDLGRRMLAALERGFSEGADRVILIGVDCPGVTEAVRQTPRHRARLENECMRVPGIGTGVIIAALWRRSGSGWFGCRAETGPCEPCASRAS